MSAPVMTFGAPGNRLASQALAAATPVSFTLDYSARIVGFIQVAATFGTVAAVAGLQIDVYRRVGTGPAADSIAVATYTIPATASTTQRKSLALPTGRYTVQLTNLDSTNSLSGVQATDDTIDSYM
jgi:hypothetical protein